MNNSEHKSAEPQFSGACIHPAIGGRLSAYITGLIEGPAVKEIEDHLLECRSCREFFSTVASMRGEARKINSARNGGDEPAGSGAKVLRLADFRKEWP